MSDKKIKVDPKKGFPGGFLFFVFALLLFVWFIQSFKEEKTSKISFSYQLEHLVNLDLISTEESQKIAQNDKLVTFSGKFRNELTEKGKDRFSYLALLDQNHQFTAEKKRLQEEIVTQQQTVRDAADWFLHISGIPLPKGGLVVVSSLYDTLDRQNSVVIRSLGESDLSSIPEVEAHYQAIKKSPTKEQVQELGNEIETLIQLFRSPKLGLGNEPLKNQLKALEQQVILLNSSTDSLEKRLEGYGNNLTELRNFAESLAEEHNHVRLASLRSVRNYVEEIDQYQLIIQKLEENELALDKARQNVADVIWFFNSQELSTRALEKQDPEVFGGWFAEAKQEWSQFSSNKGLAFQAPDQPLNTVLEKTFKSVEPSPNYFSYFLTILPVLIVVLLLYFVFSRQMKGVGSSAMNFGKSPARLLTKESNKVTFSDVAGVEEAKEELKEIVDFLKDPQKFTTLGARIPKGVLLVGPPGTGKTLIAKAVAGEADRPFFSISGSDFVEMFVGVGASRIRDLFDQGRKNAPCIIFIDEIDAVGRHRGAGIGGGHDEREQTLNQLLVEMDGFDTKEGVILMAATNRPDVLDKALLRPGRFDRRVVLDLPDVKGRYEILKVHARRIKIDPSVDLMDIARITPGASGADLGNILNESALLAARRGRKAVTVAETSEACDKVRYGKERRSLEMDEMEKKTTAFHEAGHAMVGLTVEHSDPVDRVTIIPRGFFIGATHFMPKKNRLNYWKSEALDQIAIAMGGRAAEEIFLEDMSSGAQQDIAQATKLARAMVCEWGMSKELGTMSYDERSGGEYLGVMGYHEKIYSDETAKKIDKEIYDIVEAGHKRAREIVESNRDKVQLLSDMLMEFETLDKKDIDEILHGTWDAEKKRERLRAAESLQMKSPSQENVNPPSPKSIQTAEG